MQNRQLLFLNVEHYVVTAEATLDIERFLERTGRDLAPDRMARSKVSINKLVASHMRRQDEQHSRASCLCHVKQTAATLIIRVF